MEYGRRSVTRVVVLGPTELGDLQVGLPQLDVMQEQCGVVARDGPSVEGPQERRNEEAMVVARRLEAVRPLPRWARLSRWAHGIPASD
jgi:hypothetical protein